jgi:wyosine [tRNA(Phe)-imidazoG37] synthetase (radical SAM superfamily)
MENVVFKTDRRTTGMYKHLFGPVPSRRLGMSLGVDLIPHKICSLNCVYCECGCTTTHTLERREYVPVQVIYGELEDFFTKHPDPEYITFSGAGEPTLHSHLGEVLHFIKQLRPVIPVAVLTNGTLFHLPEVRAELKQADLVLPSLDAATQEAFEKVNRPVRRFPVDQYVKGLMDFCREFSGEVWMEVLILPGYNDDPENLSAIGEALKQMNPDRIQLNTLDRPGTVQGLRAATQEELQKIQKDWGMEQVEIIAPPADRKKKTSYRSDLESVILETLSRRPCTLGDLEKILGMHINEINKYLGSLEKSGKIEALEQDRGTFYHFIGSD